MLDAMSKILGFTMEEKQTLGILKKTGSDGSEISSSG
jgi:ABC-type antimicrobial peptide transport system ATPase subunit